MRRLTASVNVNAQWIDRIPDEAMALLERPYTAKAGPSGTPAEGAKKECVA